MKPYNQTEDWIRQKKFEPDTSASMDSRVLMDSYAAMSTVQAQPAGCGHRRLFMKTTFKLAVAAVVLFMAFTGWQIIDRNGSSGMVLAEVVHRARQAKTFYHHMRSMTTGEPLTASNEPMNADGAFWFSADYGTKMEMNINGRPINVYYILPNQKKAVSIMPATKQYMEFELTDDVLGKIKQQSHDPMQWLEKMVGSKYESLGKSTLDGIEVEGFETTDPAIAGGVTDNVLVRLWVNVETGYPVQMEMDMGINEGKTKIHTVLDDFQWNPQADASLFTPDIPADYTLIPKKQLPKTDE